ncbi:MAG: pentapeptide repeat-containing protein [Bacteroidales bacterium]|nr:pentapeptide repeat-containing protein [Bacteroidales bacterium]MCF8405233.1 pentapeptide repeat-containing protein [Bacteroidales bacterium]
MKEKNKNRIDDIEIKLIRQEHRIIPAIRNYIKFKGDLKRRKAAILSIAWQLFSPSSIARVGISGAAIAGLIIAIIANGLIDRQNILIETQNTKIQEQSYLIESERRNLASNQVTNILNEIVEDIQSSEPKQQPPYILSESMTNKLIAYISTLEPYRTFDDTGALIRPLYPEKGKLLFSLNELKIDDQFLVNTFSFDYAMLNNKSFKDADLSGLDMERAKLYEVRFENVNLQNSNFYRADLNQTFFFECDLRNAHFSGSQLSNVSFANCFLPDDVGFMGADADKLHFDRAFTTDPDWIYNFKTELYETSTTIDTANYKIVPGTDLARKYFAFDEDITVYQILKKYRNELRTN